MQNNRKLVPISALISGSIITLAELQENQSLPGMNQWVAMAMVYFILSAMSDIGLPIAGGFAALIMVTVLLTRGEHALAFTRDKVREGPRGPQGRRGSSAPQARQPLQVV